MFLTFIKNSKSYFGKLWPLLLAVVAVYSGTFHNPFVYDDLPYITNNEFLRSASQLGDLFLYAPTRFLTYFTLFLNYQLSGVEVFSYHVVNLLIHLVAITLVFFFVRTLISLPRFAEHFEAKHHEKMALLIAFVFALHPLQTEAVTYVWQRSTSLAVMFYVAALLAYTRRIASNKVGVPWAAIILATLAMFTKQISATLPAAILLIEHFGVGWKDWAERRRRLFPMLLTVLVVPMIMLVFGDYDWRETHLNYPTSIYIPTRQEYFLTELVVLRDYYRLLLYPLTQNVDYDVPLVKSLSDLRMLSALAFHLGVLVAVWVSRKRFPLFAFGMTFFYVALSVESSVVPLADVQFEHRLYLPQLGFWLACLSLGYPLVKKLSFRLEDKAYVALLVVACLPLSWLTWKRNQVWTSKMAFWGDAARKSPNKSRTISSYARVLQDVGGHDEEALNLYKKSIEIDPKNSMALLSLVLMYGKLGKMGDAFITAQNLRKISEDLPEFHYSMAAIFYTSGQLESALEFFKKAVSDKAMACNSPDIAFVRDHSYDNIMTLALQLNKPDDLIWVAERALAWHPSRDDVREKLAYAYSLKKDFETAEKIYLDMLSRHPENSGITNNLATVLESNKKYEQAEFFYRKTVEKRPGEMGPQVNLVMFLAAHKPEKFEEEYKKLPDSGPQTKELFLMLSRDFLGRGLCEIASDPVARVLKVLPKSEKHIAVEMHSKLAACYTQAGKKNLASPHLAAARKLAGR